MKKIYHKDKVKQLYSEWAKTYDISSKEGLPYLVEKDLIKIINPQKNEKILDVGCGTGRITKQIYKHTKLVIGVDLSIKMLDVARNKLPHVKFIESDIDELPFAKNSFDKVVSSLTFQFLPEITKPLNEIHRVLKNKGLAYITDFVSDAPMDWKNVDYKKKKTFRGSVGALSKFRSTKEYKKAASKAGFNMIEIIPLRVPYTAKKILTKSSWEKIQDSYASVLFVLGKSNP